MLLQGPTTAFLLYFSVFNFFCFFRNHDFLSTKLYDELIKLTQNICRFRHHCSSIYYCSLTTGGELDHVRSQG